MSRFVRDNHAFPLLFTCPANWDAVPHCNWQSDSSFEMRFLPYNLAFIKWLCVEKAVRALSSGGGGRGGMCDDHVNQTRTRRGCSGRAHTHLSITNNANSFGMHCSLPTTGKLFTPWVRRSHWDQCRASVEKFLWSLPFPFHTEVNRPTTWNDTDNARLTKTCCSKGDFPLYEYVPAKTQTRFKHW